MGEREKRESYKHMTEVWKTRCRLNLGRSIVNGIPDGTSRPRVEVG